MRRFRPLAEPADRRSVRVDLHHVEAPVLIVAAPTGVVYRNQVDGVACRAQELQGFLIPLPMNRVPILDPDRWAEQLNRRSPGDEGEWAALMDELERTIDTGEQVSDLRVIDHTDNAEAWVHVSFLLEDSDDADVKHPLTGVLTWQNCD